MLKFDPVMKKLFIVGSDPASPLSESQSLDEYLESLSARMLDRKNKRILPRAISPTFKIEVKGQHGDRPLPSMVNAEDGAESAPMVKTLQASETAKDIPLLRPTHMFLQMMEEEKRDLQKDSKSGDHAMSKEVESMLNRRHPLWEKTRRRRSKINAESIRKLDDEKRDTLYPEIVSSWGPEGDLRIGIAV
jgi:hypothetical protein